MFIIDLKVWLLAGSLLLGLLGDMFHLTFCHWIPSTRGSAMCGAVADDLSTIGRDARAVGDALPAPASSSSSTSSDAGVP